jgi:hypothetical protein
MYAYTYIAQVRMELRLQWAKAVNLAKRRRPKASAGTP